MIREARGRRIINNKTERYHHQLVEDGMARWMYLCGALAAACLGGGPEKCPSALPFLIKTLTTTLYTINTRVQQGGDDTGGWGAKGGETGEICGLR